eukprot:TRINITY_DN13472_c0_g5_i1.p1 TRINITY_DN13472_c0_g5~~TRINITY_DN13472_c0_g5_i1.p1  ORF type:complete len:407 (-),score=102.99 TRINITY_DN13472_c0_g5_i1:47-1234(-)
MPRRNHGGQASQEESWVDLYFQQKGYGPPDGTIVSLTDAEHCDHVEMLTEKLDDDDPKKRLKAAEALAPYIADRAFLPEDLEIHPAEVLASAFMKAAPDRMACISAARSLAIMGEYAAPYASLALTKVLRHNAVDLRYEALVALRRFGPVAAQHAAGPLGDVALEEEEPRLRREALKALAALGPRCSDAAGKAIAEACKDEDTDVQVSAIRCMQAMGPAISAEVAAPAILQVLDHGTQEMRRRAMEAIAEIGPSLAADLSKPVALHLRPLPGSDPRLRYLAVKALEAMGPDIVYEQEVLLSRALKDPDDDVKHTAWEALRNAGCEKGMMGSMHLEERTFSPEVLEASRKMLEAQRGSEDEEDEDDVSLGDSASSQSEHDRRASDAEEDASNSSGG